ncbi:MAG: dicarboxylate/amino acid:cation symporter [Halobacteriovoraceae bacterium]|nr:dicarboxylate/amino acid:cation symporter [Halobacteriovoraceae bacterium]
MNSVNKLFDTLSYLNPRSLKSLYGHIIVLVETKLWAKVLAGMLFGVCFGVMLSTSGPLSKQLENYNSSIETLMAWLVFPAKFFLKLIKMVIIPLIFSSIIRGLASTNDVTQMKKLGIRFTIFVLVNTILASLLGILLTSFIGPGRGLSLKASGVISQNVSEGNIFSFGPDTILEIIPLNPLSSFVEGQMLDVVILSIIGGIAFLSIQKDQAKSVMDMLEVIQEICMTVISWAMRLAPYAVFGMMAQVTSSTGLKSLQNMAMYVLVCFIGFISFIIFYSIIVSIFKRISPLEFLKKSSTAILLAFSTSSSAATMPVSMKIAEDDLKVDPSTARFLIPLGTTVNMAGSAIWHTSAVIFLSQAYNINLSLPQISIVVATSIASAIGSPGVPGVGVGILASVLVKVGVPIEGVSLILGVDRIIDMGCTTVNVAGDLTASKIFSKI